MDIHILADVIHYFLLCLFIHSFVHLFIHLIYVCAHIMEARGQLLGVSSLPQLCEFQGLNSGCQAWLQRPHPQSHLTSSLDDFSLYFWFTKLQIREAEHSFDVLESDWL